MNLFSGCTTLGAMRRQAILLLFPVILSSHPCEKCHSREVQGFAQSAMSKSLRRPLNEPQGSFQAAGRTFTTASSGKGLVQKIQRGPDMVEFPVAWVIGSGKHGVGYLIRMGSELFQSPIGYYPNRHAFDFAPGYEHMAQPDFTRPVTEECLICHAGKPLHVAGTINRYEQQVFADEAISCERCHGSAERHLKNPAPGSILNPAKLDPVARDSICEQCHLSGLIRITNPSKHLEDYSPGQRLEDVFTTYVASRSTSDADDAFKSVSHSEQLALSACARNSGDKLWCGTCHDPHNKTAETAEYFAGRCLSCHQGRLTASHPSGRDCVSCHMARRNASDSAHSVFTDHRIQIRPGSHAPAQSSDLTPWRKPSSAFEQRNLALAYLNFGLKNESPAQIARGAQMLTELREAFPNDPEVLSGLGEALMFRRQPREAMLDFERVAGLDPKDVANEENFGNACLAAAEFNCAAQHFERALDLNPLLLPVANRLATLYRREGNTAKLSALSQRMLDAMRQ
jgi:hypothetical protein